MAICQFTLKTIAACTCLIGARGRIGGKFSCIRRKSLISNFTWNALGQRIFKTEPLYPPASSTSATSTSAAKLAAFANQPWNPGAVPAEGLGYAFMYGEDGTLLSEVGTGGANSAGSTYYIYLPTPSGPMPIAMVVNRASVYAVHSDHLNTPRRLTRSDGQVVWQWAYSAFGDEEPTTGAKRFTGPATHPSTGRTHLEAVTFNLRYPGQVADGETGLSYNYFRSYDARTGRYTQGDPIGMDGGWNRYLYANASPLIFTDPTGLICEYSQSGRTFTCTNAAGQTYASCTGYSGNGQGLNNPAAQNQPNVGPLPQGSYTVGGTTNRRGPNTRPLIPSPSNNMYGRAGFLLHGDNAALNNTASEGCIIIPPQCRTAVPVGEAVVVRP
jgi:RHS repeat-associated protein